MHKKLTVLICGLFMLSVVFMVSHANALVTQTVGGVLASNDSRGLCAGDPLSSLFCTKSLPDVVNTLFQFSISVGAVLALLRIAYSGYLYMGSADMWSNKTKAKEVFRDAIIGLLLLLSIYLILFQINPCILDLSVLSDNKSSCNTSPTTGFSSPSQRE